MAIYIHCGAHCGNLAAEAVLSTDSTRNFRVHSSRNGQFFNQSGKLQSKMSNLYLEARENTTSPLSLCKLCETRWLTRVTAIFPLKEQYQKSLQALEELAKSNVSVNTQAAGLLQQLSRSNTCISFHICQLIFQKVERLTSLLQTKSYTANDMMKLVRQVMSQLQYLQRDAFFRKEFYRCVKLCEFLELENEVIPSQRKPPKQFTERCEAHVAESVQL